MRVRIGIQLGGCDLFAPQQYIQAPVPRAPCHGDRGQPPQGSAQRGPTIDHC